MEFVRVDEPDVIKPIMIAATQDMGNVGSIAIDVISKTLQTKSFRYVPAPFPNYVEDKGGHIDLQQEMREYRFDNGIIIFGEGTGQPQTNQELYELCQDVIDVGKSYSAQLIDTLAAFHTNRGYGKNPKALFTTTTVELRDQIEEIGTEPTPGSSRMTRFNGLLLGYAKKNGIYGIGLHAEIDNPHVPQYRSVKSLFLSLERPT